MNPASLDSVRQRLSDNLLASLKNAGIRNPDAEAISESTLAAFAVLLGSDPSEYLTHLNELQSYLLDADLITRRAELLRRANRLGSLDGQADSRVLYSQMLSEWHSNQQGGISGVALSDIAVNTDDAMRLHLEVGETSIGSNVAVTLSGQSRSAGTGREVAVSIPAKLSSGRVVRVYLLLTPDNPDNADTKWVVTTAAVGSLEPGPLLALPF